MSDGLGRNQAAVGGRSSELLASVGLRDVFRSSLFALACALGCEAAGTAASTTGPTDELTSGGSTTTGSGTTFDDAMPCSASAECETGVCVAAYDPGLGAGAGAAGMAVCVLECIAEDALDLWCIDDASCCEGLECNAIDGFCSGAPGATSEGTIGETWMVESSSGDASSDTSTDTGTGTGTGTETSSSSSSGS